VNLNHFSYNWWNEWLSPDIDSDGITDIPYPIAGNTNNYDYFPLITSHVLIKPLLMEPRANETYSEIIYIYWIPARDTEDHNVSYSLYYSSDNGISWILIIASLSSNYYEWEVNNLPTGNYKLKIIARCSIGVESEIQSNSFNIKSSITTTEPELSTTNVLTFPTTITTAPTISITPSFTLIVVISLLMVLLKRRRM
jgi:hypothetical protein